MSKKLLNKKIFCIILIIFIFLVIVAVCIKNKNFFFIKKENTLNDETQNNIEYEENENLTENDSEYSNLKNKYNNDDLVGIIKIDGANIDEPVFKAKDNDYYLTHNGYKEEDKLGAIYLDYRFSFDTSKKKIIFGHNFENADTPFKSLEKYYDKEYYKNNKYIYLKNDNINQKYEIFSVYVETSNWNYMNEPSENKKEWLEELKKMKNNSLYDTDADVNENDEILIMQTCSTLPEYKKYEDKYLLIIAKKQEV